MSNRYRQNMLCPCGNVAPVKGGLFDTEDPEIVKREETKREESGE